MYTQRYKSNAYFELAQRFAEYARSAGVHPATLAVAWVKAHPAVTAPIIGARNVAQLEASLAAGEYKMTPEQYREIADLTPPVPPANDRDEEKT
jgi:aryl-alcohol dehydrogenase-like predicted oxidoreductase